jgi:hypothetical protein
LPPWSAEWKLVSQLLVSTKPASAPPQIVRCLKGRLQYLLREQLPKAFRRNYHVHLLLGCVLSESPQEVALGYLNNLAYAQQMRRVYQYGFYVGTVGEYDLDAIRGNL